MDNELLEEMNFEIQLLLKTGFYSDDEILEIIDDEFIEEDISEDTILKLFLDNKKEFKTVHEDSDDVKRLKESFDQLSKDRILSIHNAGYDIEEGIQDAFELYTHLRNNKFEVDGFCFYSFEDIETAVEENILPIAFGDFDYDEKKGLNIAKTINKVLKDNGFDTEWDESIDERIVIKDFLWEKSYENREYSMDGALNDYIELNKEE